MRWFATACAILVFFAVPAPVVADLNPHLRLPVSVAETKANSWPGFDASLHSVKVELVKGVEADESEGPPLVPLMIVFVISVAVLLALILAVKLPAFLALLVASLLISVGATFVNPAAAKLTELGGVLQSAMGSALGLIATVIGVGAIFGAILEISGGTRVLGQQLVKSFGVNRASWAMLVTGFLVSIPVFVDVGLVILAPLLVELAAQTGLDVLYFGLPLVVGMMTTHGFVPPTPGPIAVAAFLGVPLGYVLLFGILIGFPTALICGPFLCNVVISRLRDRDAVPRPAEQPNEGVEMIPAGEEKALADAAPEATAEADPGAPGFCVVLSMIAMPIVLILTGTVIEQVASSDIPADLAGDERKAAVKAALAAQNVFFQGIHLLGSPIVALLVSTLVARLILGTMRGITKEELLRVCNKSLEPAGSIILITGAGGMFKGVLGSSGITDALRLLFQSSNLNPFFLAWLVTAMIRIAQGSATVAMITGAGIMADVLVDQSDPPSNVTKALIACAIASGATILSHVNDSAFWMVSRYMKMTETETLQTFTPLTTAISLVSIVFIMILSLFLS